MRRYRKGQLDCNTHPKQLKWECLIIRKVYWWNAKIYDNHSSGPVTGGNKCIKTYFWANEIMNFRGVFGGRQNIFLPIYLSKCHKILKIDWWNKILCPKIFWIGNFVWENGKHGKSLFSQKILNILSKMLEINSKYSEKPAWARKITYRGLDSEVWTKKNLSLWMVTVRHYSASLVR